MVQILLVLSASQTVNAASPVSGRGTRWRVHWAWMLYCSCTAVAPNSARLMHDLGICIWTTVVSILTQTLQVTGHTVMDALCRSQHQVQSKRATRVDSKLQAYQSAAVFKQPASIYKPLTVRRHTQPVLDLPLEVLHLPMRQLHTNSEVSTGN